MRPTEETYFELQKAFDTFNALLFNNELPECVITLQREKRSCGLYTFQRFGNSKGELADSIELNPAFFSTLPLIEVMQSLCHLMVHHWQHHFGKPGRGHYHNGQFAQKMKSIGLMPSSTGKPDGKEKGDKMSDYPIEGGKFLDACETLLTSDFKIAWYDRFPTAKAIGASSASYSLGMVLPDGSKLIPSEEWLDIEIEEKEEKSKPRSKYVCCCPRSSVYGKQGLLLGCRKCGKEMKEIVGGKKTDETNKLAESQ